MHGATIITTPRADWTALAARAASRSLRRLERSERTATYLTWDPTSVRCAIFLSTPPADLIDQLRNAGFTPLVTDQLASTQVWTYPADSAALTAAA